MAGVFAACKLSPGHPTNFVNLQRNFSNIVPQETLVALQQRYKEIARTSLFLVGQLQKVIELLENQGICSIPFKGPVAALAVHGNLCLRQFGDLDVWVDPTDYVEAKQILKKSGYELEVEYGWEASLVDGNTGTCIDLHCRIAPESHRVPLVFAELYERAERFALIGHDVRILSAEDLILVLCIQLGKDGWSENPIRLSKICDIAALLQSSSKSIHWDKVFGEARKLGCLRMLMLGLLMANRMLGAPLRNSVLSSVRNEADVKLNLLVRRICFELFQEHKNKESAPISRAGFYLRLRER